MIYAARRTVLCEAFVRNALCVCVLSAFVFSIVFGDGFVMTAGVFKKDKKTGRMPNRGFVVDCLTKCEKSENCHCVRMSNRKDKPMCDLMNPFPYGKPLSPKGFVYFASNKYYETLYNVSAVNYALRKKASQSSVYELYGIQYTPEKAVDGSHNTDGLKPPYFAHTQDSMWAELNPWWQVDLNQEVTVMGIRIRNRKEWGDRLHDFDIRVGPNPITTDYDDVHFKLNTRCYYNDKSGIQDEELRPFMCKPCPIRGRYVTIQITQNCTDCREPLKNVLQLAEVEVLGLP
ncbi:uncharacterized protein LOC111266232 isoform X2 [Varroa jacobsoni]|uniref:uncharacterized protein LOC111266232 isoform X2 n=1 Tax=Varroa jacobsoni TaxID=62625 RepID=UPI000BF57FF7|nr:uncharacterized protein LOC111266232 isoform X2 [Varroa jacobsoni]